MTPTFHLGQYTCTVSWCGPEALYLGALSMDGEDLATVTGDSLASLRRDFAAWVGGQEDRAKVAFQSPSLEVGWDARL